MVTYLKIPPPPIIENVMVVIMSLMLRIIAIEVGVAAIPNIIHYKDSPWISIVASWVWIVGLITIPVIVSRDEGGLRQYLINRGGRFSRQHYAIIDIQERTVGFGYRLFGYNHYYILIPLEAVTALSWGAGQATGMSGKDMNDWTVDVWFRNGEERPRKRPYANIGREVVYIASYESRKEKAEKLGFQLVEFLRGYGVPLISSAGRKQFQRTDAYEKSLPINTKGIE